MGRERDKRNKALVSERSNNSEGVHLGREGRGEGRSRYTPFLRASLSLGLNTKVSVSVKGGSGIRETVPTLPYPTPLV